VRLSRSGLSALLHKNAAELRFIRRVPKEFWSNRRRMLCTNDMTLLRSIPGTKVLNFQLPLGIGLPYDPNQHNLLITWDIFMQNWRAIPCESVDVIAVIKTQPPQEFWKYFMQQVVPLTATRKGQFMNT
jgi:hypothetical protein